MIWTVLKKNRRSRLLREDRGFTLPEALVTVLIFSIILTASTVLLLAGTDSWQVNEVQIELQQELRKSMDWIAKDLRQAGPASIVDVAAGGGSQPDINFAIASGTVGGAVNWSSNIQYVRGGSDGNQLQRIQGGTARLIARNITGLQFLRQSASPDLVEVTLQAQRTSAKGRLITDTLNFQVQLRN